MPLPVKVGGTNCTHTDKKDYRSETQDGRQRRSNEIMLTAKEIVHLICESL